LETRIALRALNSPKRRYSPRDAPSRALGGPCRVLLPSTTAKLCGSCSAKVSYSPANAAITWSSPSPRLRDLWWCRATIPCLCSSSRMFCVRPAFRASATLSYWKLPEFRLTPAIRPASTGNGELAGRGVADFAKDGGARGAGGAGLIGREYVNGFVGLQWDKC